MFGQVKESFDGKMNSCSDDDVNFDAISCLEQYLDQDNNEFEQKIAAVTVKKNVEEVVR